MTTLIAFFLIGLFMGSTITCATALYLETRMSNKREEKAKKDFLKTIEEDEDLQLY